jgi:hypothetical protein
VRSRRVWRNAVACNRGPTRPQLSWIEAGLLSRGSQVRVLPGALLFSEGLRPSDSPTRSRGGPSGPAASLSRGASPLELPDTLAPRPRSARVAHSLRSFVSFNRGLCGRWASLRARFAPSTLLRVPRAVSWAGAPRAPAPSGRRSAQRGGGSRGSLRSTARECRPSAVRVDAAGDVAEPQPVERESCGVWCLESGCLVVLLTVRADDAIVVVEAITMKDAGRHSTGERPEIVPGSRDERCAEALRSSSSNDSGEALQSPNRERLRRLDSPIHPPSPQETPI